MHIERSFVRSRRPLIEDCHEFIPGDNTADCAHQVFEYIELDRREIERCLASPCLSGLRFDPELAAVEFSRALAHGRSTAPQHSANAGKEFFGAEGFGQVIVGARIQPGDSIPFCGSGR